MGDPKAKQTRRVAGASKFRLPERSPRLIEVNPLRELLQEAKDQEESQQVLPETAKNRPRKKDTLHTPAINNAGVKVLRHSDKTNISLISPIHDEGTKTLLPAPINSTTKEEKTDDYGIRCFADFSKRWAPILRTGQMSICRVLYEKTHAINEKECFTSMPKLAMAAGLKERQCYNVVSQLEQLGFIARPEIFNTPTKKGSVFRLFLFPNPFLLPVDRQYHIGGID